MKNIKIVLLLVTLFSLQSIMAQQQEKYYFSKTLNGSFEEVTALTKAALKEEGFGLITEIDMDAKVAEKFKAALDKI